MLHFDADLVAKSKCGGSNSKRVLLSEVLVRLIAIFFVALGRLQSVITYPTSSVVDVPHVEP
jgi:hypothetical protein